MFTRQELQVLTKTLVHRRDWLAKNIDLPEQAVSKTRNQETLTLIDSALRKLATLEEKNEGPREAASSTAKFTVQQRRQQLPAEKIRILLADDDKTSSALITAYLQDIGIQYIDIADDGLKAISMLFGANPIYDLVLCDWNMPFKNGLDVHNAMRAAERYQDVYFMLVTAITEAKQIRAAVEEGVDDYLAKPIEQATLAKKMARIFPQIKLNE